MTTEYSTANQIERALAALGGATELIQAVIDSFPDNDFSSTKRKSVQSLWRAEEAQRLLREAGEDVEP